MSSRYESELTRLQKDYMAICEQARAVQAQGGKITSCLVTCIQLES
jgi:hypothetical protein